MVRKLKIFAGVFLALFILLYAALRFILPPVLSTNCVSLLLSDLISKKTGAEVNFYGQKISISEFINVKIFLPEIMYKDKNKTLILNGFKADLNPFKIRNSKINLKKLYFETGKTKAENKNKNEKSLFSRIDLAELPELYIDSAVVKISSVNEEKTLARILIDNFSVAAEDNGKTASFNLLLKSDYMFEDVKIDKKSKFFILKDGIYTNGFTVYFKNSSAYLQGKILDVNGESDFLAKGNNLPVYDIEKGFLLYLKQLNNKKLFIENFKDFGGKLDLNLNFKGKKIFGKAIFHKLCAATVPLNIPLHFNKVVFNFENKTVNMNAKGTFGGEAAFTDFYLTGLFTPQLEISGSVKSSVTNNFAKKYIEGLAVKGNADLSVDYLINNGVIDIIYNAEIDNGSDIFYLGSRLGLNNLKRTINAVTRKVEDTITLVNYKYTFADGLNEKEILTGTGLFNKQNGKYKIDKISLKTMDNAPVSLLGFLESRLKGGEFDGALEFDFVKSKLSGSFILKDSFFKGFEIKNAAIFTDENSVTVLGEGRFKNEIFNCIIELKNSFNDELLIHNLELYLKKYVMNSYTQKNKKQKPKMPPMQEFKPDKNITVEKLNLRLDSFVKDNLLVENLNLKGHSKDNILHFSMPDVAFAKGGLSASGLYDFNKNYGLFDFAGTDIDANTASYQVFNLKDHIKGKTGAKLKVEFFNGFETMKGTAVFYIKKGSLPQLGSKEFIIKGRRKKRPFKFSISDIIKIGKNADLNPDSNIKGYFNITNSDIENINIIMSNDSVSFFIEGNYNIKSQYSKLDIWGKYDRGIESKITIFHIPLSFIFKFVFKINEVKNKYIEKILKIPSIKTENERIFNVQLEGNLNNPKSLKLKFKSVG